MGLPIKNVHFSEKIDKKCQPKKAKSKKKSNKKSTNAKKKRIGVSFHNMKFIYL